MLVCGYDKNDNDIQKKFVIKINKSSSIDPHHGYGAAWVGRTEIPSLFNNHGIMGQFGLHSINLLFNSMNIQDAIDYNRFLINTVIGFQKFAPMAPDVGGNIEVGVLCLGREYHWVNRMAWA